MSGQYRAFIAGQVYDNSDLLPIDLRMAPSTDLPVIAQKKRRGRQPGFVMTQAHKDKLSAAQVASWKVRKVGSGWPRW
ncbi:MAG: hypothetical protein JWP29_1944 [Rhodoferax sp.]|nr:hypothetical protein [Rhodoferax sp.]